MNGSADVIVAGAGPAGSTAAAVLARAGVNVLLVDREPFPRAKACGDVVPAGCLLELRKIGMSSFGFDAFPVSQVLLQGPAHTERRFDLEQQQGLSTCVVSRTLFDYTLVEYAQACGAHFTLLNVRGPILDGTRVIGVRGRTGDRTVAYSSRVVIGADGATSSIARTLAGQSQPDAQWAVALRGYVATDVELDGTIELAFLDHLQAGYAWFFPSGERCANVGVGIRADFYKRQARPLRELLDGYLAMPSVAQRIGHNPVTELRSWPLPLFNFERPRVFDGALLAGDAGGFVHPITAAGIYPAIVTGKLAAEAALQALEQGDLSTAGLACYDTLWQDALAADFRPGVAAGKLATLFPQVICAVLGLSPSAAKSPQTIQASLPTAFGKF